MDVIIVPTYNEKENVGVLVPRIFELIPNIQIVVVDDNSPDGTRDVVEELMKKYKNLSMLDREKKEGLGTAYIFAFKHVLRDHNIRSIIMMDADLSHDPAALPEMIKASRSFDCVVGSRYVSGGTIVGWKLWRKLLSFFGNFYCRIVAHMPVRDCTGGFNVINTDVLRRVNLDSMNSSGYTFIVELKFLLAKAGATFTEIPITFKDRVEGTSKMSNYIIQEGIIAPWRMRNV